MKHLQRYKFGYISDEWGMNQHLGLIPDPNGSVCKYDDVKELEDMLKCVKTNLEKGMSKSIQKLQAREL